MNFTTHNKIMEIGASVAAGSAIDDNSDIIDMSGWQSATFIAPITDSVATGLATLTIEQNAANSDTGMAALSGAKATVTSAVNDDLNGKLLVVEIDRPQERYLQAVRTSATAAIAFGNVLCILSGPRIKPVAKDASIADMVLAIEPDKA